MATYVIGLLILVLLFLAGREVVKNLRTGGHDCCGCGGWGASAECGKSSPAAHGEEAAGCPCCSAHK